MTVNGQKVTFTYDAAGTPLTMKVYKETEGNGISCDTYYYITNLQGDVMELVNTAGTTVVSYSYTAYGEVTTTGDTAVIALNPLTYRGYVYDAETGLFYLQSRYYAPEIGRFFNADALVATGQGLLGNNMFAYCGNNPVNRADPSGNWWQLIPLIIIPLILSGCDSNSDGPRSDLANAEDLKTSDANFWEYNCYGNAIKKKTLASPTGYQKGDSVRKTFNAVKNDLGADNVRELTSPSDPISEDEYVVAMRCGPDDYHFIRLDENGWYNKSGTMPGLLIDQSMVESYYWFGAYPGPNGELCLDPYTYYEGEVIYFAVKEGWDDE